MINPLDNMKVDSPLYRTLSDSGRAEAKKAARLLQGFLDMQKVPANVGGCSQCKARLENPHADYVIPAPQIDSSKF